MTCLEIAFKISLKIICSFFDLSRSWLAGRRTDDRVSSALEHRKSIKSCLNFAAFSNKFLKGGLTFKFTSYEHRLS